MLVGAKEPVVAIITNSKVRQQQNPSTASKSLAQYLFGSKGRKVKLEVTDEVHSKYVGLLKEALKEVEKKLEEHSPPSLFKDVINMQKVHYKSRTNRNSKNNTFTRSKSLLKENRPAKKLRKKESVDEALSDIEELVHTLFIPKMHTNEKTRKRMFAGESAKFSIRVGSAEPAAIVKEMQKEIHTLAGMIIEAWNKYIKLVHESPSIIAKTLAEEYNKALKRSFEQFIFRKTSETIADEQVGKLRSEKIAKFASKLPVTLRTRVDTRQALLQVEGQDSPHIRGRLQC